MNKITLWYRYNPKKKQFEYNHYEDGWDHLSKPLTIMNGGDRWAKEVAYMDGETIKHVDEV